MLTRMVFPSSILPVNVLIWQHNSLIPRLLHFSTLNYPTQLKLTFQNNILSHASYKTNYKESPIHFGGYFRPNCWNWWNIFGIIFKNLRFLSNLFALHIFFFFSESYCFFHPCIISILSFPQNSTKQLQFKYKITQ